MNKLKNLFLEWARPYVEAQNQNVGRQLSMQDLFEVGGIP